MLSVPLLVGVVRSGPSLSHLLVGLFWFAGYFAFFAAGQWLRARRSLRRRRALVPPLLTYTSLSALLGLVLAWDRPDLLPWTVAFLPLAATSLAHSWRHRDRALLNDAVTIAAACLIAMVAYQIGTQTGFTLADHGWRVMAGATLALFGYFFGTGLYVKTVIRERSNRAYHRASVGYHALVTLLALWALLAGAGVPWTVVVFFGVMTARAAVMAGRTVRPRSVGLGELAASTVLLVLCLLW